MYVCVLCTLHNTAVLSYTPSAPTNTCSDGTPVVSCFNDPCGECPNYPNARCEVNYCGGCDAVYYDDRGNNVTDYCRTYTGSHILQDAVAYTYNIMWFFTGFERLYTSPINTQTFRTYIAMYIWLHVYDLELATLTGCEVIFCAPGYKCIGNPITGSAYCDPSCEEPYVTFNCGDEQRCTLIDGDCPPDHLGPCPHRVQCTDIEPGDLYMHEHASRLCMYMYRKSFS